MTTAGRCVVAVMAVTLSSGCKTGPASFSEKFGVGTGDAHITQFYFSGFGMDHSYVWIIEPVDDALVESMVKATSLTRREGFEGSGLSSDGFPTWWDRETIEKLDEGYYRDGDRQFWRVWVDRRSNRIFAQWFDT